MEAQQSALTIRAMFERGAEMKRRFGADAVADLSLGNPIVEPPPEAYARLRELVLHPVPGSHRYMPNAGIASVRGAVARFLREQTSLEYEGDYVTMTVGAAGALNVLFRTLLRQGGEVIGFAPYFPEYPEYVSTHGGTFRACPCDAAFVPDLGALEPLLGPKTRAIIFNSPNNPSGVTYPETVLTGLGQLLRDKCGGAPYLVSDEPYRDLVYDRTPVPWPALYYDRVVHITSFSKNLCMAGERIGYLALSPRDDSRKALQPELAAAQRVLGFVNAPALQQRMVESLLGVTPDLTLYARNWRVLCDSLRSAGYAFVEPSGAFYVFPQIPPGYADENAFAEACLEEKLLVVPGSPFGLSGHFRISFSVTEAELDRGAERLAKVFRR